MGIEIKEYVGHKAKKVKGSKINAKKKVEDSDNKEKK